MKLYMKFTLDTKYIVLISKKKGVLFFCRKLIYIA